MKKIAFLLAMLMIVSVFAVVLTGCGDDTNDAGLTIRVAKLGYGTDWIKAIAAAYEAKTGIKVSIKEAVGQDGQNAIDAEQEAYSNKFDMYITRERDYFQTIYEGKVSIDGKEYDCLYADLTDVYTDAANGASIESRMDPDQAAFYKVNGKYYGMPWADGIMGILRNKDLWDALGLTDEDMPRTTNEMFALCDKINEIKVAAGKADIAPFIYCHTDEYYTPFVPIWFAQYEGVENTSKFLNGLDLNGEETYNLYAYDGLVKALEVLQKLTANGNPYHSQSADGLTFTQMQAYFLADQAVFNVNGSWIETEMSANAKGKNIDVIPTPIISALAEKLSFYNKDDLEGTDAKLAELVSYVDGKGTLPEGTTEADAAIVREARQSASYMRESVDHIVTIPAHCKNMETAKDFLKFMYSNEGLQLYYDNTMGNVLPIEKDGGYGTATELSSFRQNVNSIMEEGHLLNWYRYMPTKLFSLGTVDAYYKNGSTSTVMKDLYAGKTPEEIITININYLQKNWNSIIGKYN